MAVYINANIFPIFFAFFLSLSLSLSLWPAGSIIYFPHILFEM